MAVRSTGCKPPSLPTTTSSMRDKIKSISLDYDIPLGNCDYSRYVNSDVFSRLKETAAEGQTNPDFIFYVTAIQFGSMALTAVGQEVLETI